MVSQLTQSTSTKPDLRIQDGGVLRSIADTPGLRNAGPVSFGGMVSIAKY